MIMTAMIGAILVPHGVHFSAKVRTHDAISELHRKNHMRTTSGIGNTLCTVFSDSTRSYR